MKLAAFLRRPTLVLEHDRTKPASALSAGLTHVGRVRTMNEDCLLDRPDRGLWAVADGMGGHRGGAAAARLAVDALDVLADEPAPLSELAIRQTLARASQDIHAQGATAGTSSGTTIVVALLHGDAATILWVGDSRAYKITHGRGERLTRDHSLVQDLVDRGLLSDEAAPLHPNANVITRALGVSATVVIESVTVTLARGDRLLLCSDGLWKSLLARDFERLPAAISVAADRLLTNGLQRDGSDNCTVVLIEPQSLAG